MVMPGDTACPWRTKFTLLALSEALRDELPQGLDRLLRVGSLGLDEHRRAPAGGEHHDAHDALRVDPPAAAREPDLGLESARDLGELRRGPRVQAELVHDLDFLTGHRSSGRCSCAPPLRRRPSMPAPPPRAAPAGPRRGSSARGSAWE